MRKILPLLFAVLLLVGCSSQKTAAPFTTDLLATLNDCGAFSEPLESMDSDLTMMLYGLDEGDVTACASIRSTGATCEEAGVVICPDASAAKRVSDALAVYVDDQKSANEDYRPAEMPKLADAQIITRENTVLLAVANDVDKLSGAIG